MKNKNLVILLLIMVLIITTAGCVKEKPGIEAAIVNGEVITVQEYEETLEVYKSMYKNQYGDTALETEIEPGVTLLQYLQENILENLIFERIIYQEALKNDLAVDDTELDELMVEYKTFFEDEQAYTDFLTSNNMDEDFLKNSLRRDEVIQKYADFYMENLEISEEDLLQYYEDNVDKFVSLKARHILVNSMEEAKDILAQINEGADFSELAKTYSEDTNSAINGGDLGYFYKGQMVPAFEEAAFSLEIGEVSGIIPSDFGFHIIKLDDRSEGFEDKRELVLSEYKNVKYSEKMDELEIQSAIERKLDL
ncbi:MAG: Foldase protein PrsA [Clostridiales bacterium 38_11]|nr:MAG: Foldase protein PrsA [Clostridiales bacterium 38_11]